MTEKKHTPTREQQDIYNFIANGSGNAIIDAVAGAGKTTTIVNCVEHINIDWSKYRGEHSPILFCAFNVSIRDKIKEEFKKKRLKVDVKTMHGLGMWLLGVNGKVERKETDKDEEKSKLVDREKSRKIIQEDDFIYSHRDELRIIYNYWRRENDKIGEDYFEGRLEYAQNNDKPYYFVLDQRIKDTFTDILDVNKKFKQTLTDNNVEDFEQLLLHYGYIDEVVPNKPCDLDTRKAYIEAFLTVNNAIIDKSIEQASQKIDFEDMLYLPSKRCWNLTSQGIWQYQYVFVDECQDLSVAQQEIIFSVLLKPAGRVIAVGDPNQAIYGFSGADSGSFNTMKKRLKVKDEFTLSGSFRCPPKVVNKAKELKPIITSNNRKHIGVVRTIELDNLLNEVREGDFIVSRWKRPFNEIIKMLVESNKKVYVTKETKDNIIKEFRGTFSKNESTRNIIYFNSKDVNREKEFIKIHMRNRIYGNFIKDDDYENKDEKFATMWERAEFCFKKLVDWQCYTLGDVVEKIGEYIYVPDKNNTEEDVDYAVSLHTIHKAKGLEARRIFILDIDRLPWEKDDWLDWEFEQEKNLLYVAYTRALEELYLVKSKKKENIQQHFDEEGCVLDSNYRGISIDLSDWEY